jgi:hypothetical protein
LHITWIAEVRKQQRVTPFHLFSVGVSTRDAVQTTRVSSESPFRIGTELTHSLLASVYMA